MERPLLLSIWQRVWLKKEKVLAIDLDPQGNMTSGLGVNKDEVENTVYNLMLDECSIAESIENTVVDNLYVIPSNVNLAGAEIELLGIMIRNIY